MKWLIILTLSLQGCAYTVASTATYITTGKSITDHAASTLTQADCGAVNYLQGRQDYLCEQAPDPGVRYNRNGY